MRISIKHYISQHLAAAVLSEDCYLVDLSKDSSDAFWSCFLGADEVFISQECEMSSLDLVFWPMNYLDERRWEYLELLPDFLNDEILERAL